LVEVIVGPNREKIVGKEVGDLARKMERAIPPKNMNGGVCLMGRAGDLVMWF
jgi:hypothetical protein